MIETKRCKLINLHESDFEDVKKLYINSQVRKYLGGAIEDNNLLLNKFNETIGRTKADSFYWVVRLLDNHEFIGLVSLEKYHDGLNIEISYELLPLFWGRGLAMEVVSRIITFGFKDLGLQKLVAETQTKNTLSCNLLERVGMHLETRIHRFGAEQSVYSIIRI